LAGKHLLKIVCGALLLELKALMLALGLFFDNVFYSCCWANLPKSQQLKASGGRKEGQLV
jgi:hypothetical protein